MKHSALFEKCLSDVNSEVRIEVWMNIEIANRISYLLNDMKISQRDFANRLGKKESEISRWLTGKYGFTTKSLARISAVLGRPIIEVSRTKNYKG